MSPSQYDPPSAADDRRHRRNASDLSTARSDDLPVHPIPSMQAAFEESIREAAQGLSRPRRPSQDAEARRKILLDQDKYDTSWVSRWRQTPDTRCHPLVKFMSQIIFGMHLLDQSQAKSDNEVIKILQVHVDDIDAFLERTTDDLELARKDIEERVSFLRLPMTHLDVFNNMLADRAFRTQLLQGNDQIENIVNRTAKAMHAVLSDVQKAISVNKNLAQYLDSVAFDWPRDKSAILLAMKGNEEGWRVCLRDLQGRGHGLGLALVQLGTVVTELNSLAASASRRSTNASTSPQTDRSGLNSQHSHLSESTFASSRLSVKDKPLPREPDAMVAAITATMTNPWPQPKPDGPSVVKEAASSQDLRRTNTNFARKESVATNGDAPRFKLAKSNTIGPSMAPAQYADPSRRGNGAATGEPSAITRAMSLNDMRTYTPDRKALTQGMLKTIKTSTQNRAGLKEAADRQRQQGNLLRVDESTPPGRSQIVKSVVLATGAPMDRPDSVLTARNVVADGGDLGAGAQPAPSSPAASASRPTIASKTRASMESVSTVVRVYPQGTPKDVNDARSQQSSANTNSYIAVTTQGQQNAMLQPFASSQATGAPVPRNFSSSLPPGGALPTEARPLRVDTNVQRPQDKRMIDSFTPKADSAYALESAPGLSARDPDVPAPLRVSRAVSTTASLLALFPDTTITTPVNRPAPRQRQNTTPRLQEFTPQYPTTPDPLTRSASSGRLKPIKITKIFKRRSKDTRSFVI